MKVGDRVVLDPGPQHPAQFRRAVPREAILVSLDPPWCEVRGLGPQPLPVETYFVPLSEVRHAPD